MLNVKRFQPASLRAAPPLRSPPQCQFQIAHGKAHSRGTLAPGADSYSGVRAPVRNHIQLADVLETRSGRAGFTRQKGKSMGDRGGKKDKKKSQQQLATKQKHKEQRKLDKAPSKPLAATT